MNRAVRLLSLCFAIVPMPAAAQERTLDCRACHEAETSEFDGSVHVELECQECHGGAESYAVPATDAQRYLGRACGECHANVERMNPYGLRTDQLARYWTSGHGKTLSQKGDDRVAVCTDCHGHHKVLPGDDPAGLSHPLNVPNMCAACHENAALMAEYDLPTEVVQEYRLSVHGGLLLEQHDTGAPTCATCHGNHSAMPPGFATVGAVCGQCHKGAAEAFETSIHASQSDFKGCVQCHGAGEDRHFHLIERITKPTGVLVERYARLIAGETAPTPEEISASIHPDPTAFMERVLPTCLDCHDELEEDESLQRLFHLLEQIADAERTYVKTAHRLDEVGRGVLLVENQRFRFEDANTHLIELAPLQHTLDNDKVAAKVSEVNEVCGHVDAELDDLQTGLRLRRMSLVPVWLFSLLFAAALYVKFRQLKAAYVKPLPRGAAGH